MDFALNGAVSWLYNIVSQLLSSVTYIFLDSLGCNLDTFNAYFPFASTAYWIIQGFSVGLLFLIFFFEISKSLISPLTEAESPLILTLKTFIFIVPLLSSKEIFDMILNIFGTAYNLLMNSSTNFSTTTIDWTKLNTTIMGIFDNTTVGQIIALIALILIGWNFFKLLLEVAERYVIIGVLAYLAPLPFSTGASKATNNIFKSWCRMSMSQFVMLLLNVWSIKIFISAFSVFSISEGMITTDNTQKGGIILWCICVLAFLKVAQKLDSYMSQLGLNTAQTGGSLLDDLAVVGAGVKNTFGAMGSVAGRAAFGSAAGGALGALGMSAQTANNVRSIFGAGSSSTTAAVNSFASGIKSSGSGGAATVSGGVLGGIASSVVNNRILKGLSTSNMNSNSRSYKSATNVVSQIANGSDISKTGFITDTSNPKSGQYANMGTRAFEHYFDQKGTSNVGNVTLGGGKITGMDTATGKSWEMLNTNVFQPHDGAHETFSSIDGTKWSKQIIAEGSKPSAPRKKI